VRYIRNFLDPCSDGQSPSLLFEKATAEIADVIAASTIAAGIGSGI
jgi:hypothetical protein